MEKYNNNDIKNSALLCIENLSIQINDRARKFLAVDNFSLQINPNQILAIIGESGSGKTLTALAVLGLLPQQAKIIFGKIKFKNKQIALNNNYLLKQIRGKLIATIFQEPQSALNPVIRIGKQIRDVITEHLKLTKFEAKNKTIKILQEVGLPEPDIIYDSYPHQLSGGMAQRAMIAMALSCNPELIIADEPTTALDVTTQKKILNLLSDLQKKYQYSLLLISHDLNVVSILADYVIVLKNGKTIEQGNTKSLLSQPKNPYTKLLLNS